MLRTTRLPLRRPDHGYCRPCRIQATKDGEVDIVEVMVAEMAFYVVLLDVGAPPRVIHRPGHEATVNPKAIRAEQVFWQIVDSVPKDSISAWIPEPPGKISRLGWHIQPRSLNPGVIYLGEELTLNHLLVKRGVCKLPKRIDNDTLREAA